jgi:hypothetical protein
MLGSSRVAAQLAASREGLGSMSEEGRVLLVIRFVVVSFPLKPNAKLTSVKYHKVLTRRLKLCWALFMVIE